MGSKIEHKNDDEDRQSKLDFYLEIIGQPFFFPNLYLPNKAFKLASDKGIALMMNGNDGDSVISHGYEYFLELFSSLRWVKLFQQINSTAKINNQTGQSTSQSDEKEAR